MGLDFTPRPRGQRAGGALRRAGALLVAAAAGVLSRPAGAAPAAPDPAPLPPPRYVPGGAPLDVGPRAVVARGAVSSGGAVPARTAVDPFAPPPPPRRTYRVRVDPDVGHVKQFPAEDGKKAYVLTGNPSVSAATGFSVRANVIVVWVDAKSSSGLTGFFGASGAAGAAPRPTEAAGARLPPVQGSIVPDALISVYAEGAVDFQAGETAFRASRLWFDARENRALLVEPRFEQVVAMKRGEPDLPLHLRAERARVVSDGLAVFDRAELSTSRANDGFQVRIDRLTMEEYGRVTGKDASVLGFRTEGIKRPGATRLENAAGTRHYVFQGIHARGERLPLAYWPRAEFGGEEGVTNLPVHLHLPQIGSRSSLGRYAILPVSGDLLREPNAVVEWTLEGGGFTKRGFAGGADLEWHRRAPKTADGAFRPRVDGKLDTFLGNDLSGHDRDGFDAPRGPRWKIELENRWDPRPDLRFDAELNAFSDRGFDHEFFESDFRTHKDRETYARMRWMEGGAAVTATAGMHLRDFVTESVAQPAVDLWSESVPLVPGSRRFGVDLSSAASAARLVRRFDEALDLEGYEAFRLDVTERLYAPFDLGDVRVSPFFGFRGTGYYDRTDGGDDVTRTALEAGVRANLQLHRDFAAFGGPWSLDGLRHVVDLDAGAYARFSDSASPDDVPFFDRVDAEESRTEVFVQVSTRIETRREAFGVRRNASLFDGTLRLSGWPDRIGPYGKRGTGELEARFEAMLAPDRLWLRGDSVASLEGAAFEHSSLALEYSPHEDLEIGAGIRHVHKEVLAPWADVYWRWSEKWAARASVIRDFESGRAETARFSVIRFSEDHSIELGFSIRNGGDDFGVVLDLQPLIGGTPLRSPFDPRDRIDFSP